jgi:hypothetical protein
MNAHQEPFQQIFLQPARSDFSSIVSRRFRARHGVIGVQNLSVASLERHAAGASLSCIKIANRAPKLS